MLSKRSLIGGAAIIVVLAAVLWPFFGDKSNPVSDQPLTELGWADLIPDDFVQPENPLASMTQEEIDKLMDGSAESNAELAKLEEAFYYAPVVDNLDGLRVKIPAYITPLDFDGATTMSEFLLVPYVGACMHTPPPPANQIVHAESDELVELQNVYDPVWAIGTIKTELVKSVLAESGYRLEVEEILPYSPPE